MVLMRARPLFAVGCLGVVLVGGVENTVGEQCLIDRVNVTLHSAAVWRGRPDVLDWAGSDWQWVGWFKMTMVDYVLDATFCPSLDFAACLEGRWREDGFTVLSSALGVCQLALGLRSAARPYVVVSLSENWGAFSSQRLARTANWGYWDADERCVSPCARAPAGETVASVGGLTYAIRPDGPDAAAPARTALVREWLESPSLRLVVTSQHQSSLPRRHGSKALSLPLGVRPQRAAELFAMVTSRRRARRRLLLINNSGWRFRANINANVSRHFEPPLENTYCTHRAQHCADALSVDDQLLESKFALCPPGFGTDSYRLWEVALYYSVRPI